MSEKKNRKNKMSKSEREQWDNLYQYVKRKIMGYDDNQSLSFAMILRLKGLKTNKYYESKHIENLSNYSYGLILETFQYCADEIDKALQRISFSSQMHKLNFVCKIVENHLNDVYVQNKDKQQADKIIKNMNLQNLEQENVTYQSQYTGLYTPSYVDESMW